MAGPISSVGQSVFNALGAIQGGAIGGSISLVIGLTVLWATLYYIGMGYSIMWGRIQEPVGDFLKSCVKFILIASVALSVQGYNKYIVTSANEIMNGVASAWSGTSGTPLDMLDRTVIGVIYGGMTYADAAHNLPLTPAEELPLSNLGTYFILIIAAVIVWIGGFIFVIPAAAMIIVCQSLFIILVGVGPIFVMSLMFPFISKWFDAWFSQIMTQIFTVGLLCMIISAENRIFTDFLNLVKKERSSAGLTTGDLNMTAIFNLVVTSAILLFVMYKSLGVAAGLGGGVASEALTFGRMAGGAASGIGGAASAARSGASIAGSTARGAGRTLSAVRPTNIKKGIESGFAATKAGAKSVWSGAKSDARITWSAVKAPVTGASYLYNRFLKR